jgi:hypothetical protein
MNATHGQFGEILRAAGPRQGPLCQALRDLILSLDNDGVEIVWPRQRIASFGVGPKKMTDHYAYIGIQSSHVNLGFYHGAVLKDSERLLEGTGKRLRHVKIRSLDEANNPAIVVLLREAIVDREKHAQGSR